jgi:hypothetical protein
MNPTQYATFKTLFEGFIANPETIDPEQAARIDEILDDIDRAAADHGRFMNDGGSHAGWLMNVLVEEFGDQLPEPLREFGPIAPAAASTLAELASSYLPRSIDQTAGTPSEVEQAHVEFDAGGDGGRVFKRAASAALHKATSGKVPLEACVAAADMGVETVRTCVDVANGEATPLEAYSRLTDRAVAVAGALVRQATRIGAQAAGAALGVYVGQPALGRAVGAAVGNVVAYQVGAAAERGLRTIARAIPSTARKLKSAAKSTLTNLKRMVFS